MRIDPCPDCNAREEHELTCPLLADIDAIAMQDAFWFERYPWIRFIVRAMTNAERAEMTRRGFVPAADHRIRVTLYPNNIWIHEVVA